MCAPEGILAKEEMWAKKRRENQCEGRWVSRGGRKRVLTGVNLHIQTVKDPSTATLSSIFRSQASHGLAVISGYSRREMRVSRKRKVLTWD